MKLLNFTTVVLLMYLLQYQTVSCSFSDFFNGILNGLGFGKPTYKLSYFNITGRAEFIRWIFACDFSYFFFT